ncbi:MAG: hypothetical protein GTN78_10725, partial [Gemmatimonadales bacterium]|nr:hypothetical protein [Gemmatimonadales bacterium]
MAAIALPLIAWATVCWLRHRPAMAGPLIAGSALLVIWVLGYGDTSDSKVWLIPLGAVLALFAGTGSARLASWSPGSERYVGPAAAGVFALAVCSILLFANWSRADRSDMWGYRYTWASATIQTERDAILVGDSDASLFVIRYLQLVEGKRRDLTV